MCFAPVVLELLDFWFNQVHRADRTNELAECDANAAVLWEGTDFGIGRRRVRGVVHSAGRR